MFQEPKIAGLHFVGSLTRPIKRMPPERLSRIRKTNGWSARNSGGGVGSGARIAIPTIATAVAAAASVPTSFTSIKALWITAERNNSRLPVIPEKSAALLSNALGIPIAPSVLPSSSCSVTLNLGNVTITLDTGCNWLSHCLAWDAVSDCSRSEEHTSELQSLRHLVC